MEKDKIAYEQLIQGIQGYIDKCLDNSGADITTVGLIKEIYEDDEGYSVEINGQLYENVRSIGGLCTINETVNILIPQGNYNNMLILKGGVGASGEDSTVTSVNGKVGTVVLTAEDVGALSSIPIATQERLGGVKVDGTSITIDADGTIHSIGGGGGSGNVISVNGKDGIVILKTSNLVNDSNYIADANYVHTDNNFSNTYKNKLDLWDLTVNADGSVSLIYNGD